LQAAVNGSFDSRIVVVSWWSNCLGWTTLDRLVSRTGQQRRIHVVQVGKPEAAKAAFRQRLPARVQELPLLEDAPAEHGAVLERASRLLGNGPEGIWFFDHDALVEEECEAWLEKVDSILAPESACLATLETSQRAITSPAFWIHRGRLPRDTPSKEGDGFSDSCVRRLVHELATRLVAKQVEPFFRSQHQIDCLLVAEMTQRKTPNSRRGRDLGPGLSSSARSKDGSSSRGTRRAPSNF
jgi:hypothetical protein